MRHSSPNPNPSPSPLTAHRSPVTFHPHPNPNPNQALGSPNATAILLACLNPTAEHTFGRRVARLQP
eukprot:scaffold113231_cov51-Phaeocystis_antarctica.AAC.1